MHPALGIDELFRTILLSLSLSDLLAVATVCRAFVEPALDTFWALNDVPVHRLWGLLPSQGHVDWNRFYSATSRLTSVTYVPRSHTMPISIKKSFSGIRRVKWEISDEDELELLHHFIAAGGVMSLTLTCRDMLPELPEAICTSLQAYCHNLTHFALSLDKDSVPSFSDLLGPLLRSFKSLRSLKLNFKIQDSTLLQLAALDTLRHLSFSCDRLLWQTVKGSSPQLFPAIITLEVQGSCSSSQKILESISSRYPEQISMMMVPLSTIALRRALTRASTFRNLGFLEFISSLKGMSMSDDLWEVCDITVDDLRPLLDCRNLVYVVIEYIAEIALYDEDLLEMAKAWRGLQVLRLGTFVETRYSPWTPTRASSLCLRAFSHYCPELRELGVFFDARSISDFANDFQHNATSMRRLRVGMSPIQDSDVVAVFLLRIFPGIRDVVWNIGGHGDGMDEWESSQESKTRWDRWASVESIFRSRLRDLS